MSKVDIKSTVTYDAIVAKAIQLVRLHNAALIFQEFVDTGTATPGNVVNNAYIVTEDGTVLGITAKKGQIIVDDGSIFIAESFKIDTEVEKSISLLSKRKIISELELKELINEADNLIIEGEILDNNFYKYNFLTDDLISRDATILERYIHYQKRNEIGIIDPELLPLIAIDECITDNSSNSGSYKATITEKWVGGCWLKPADYPSGVRLIVQYRNNGGDTLLLSVGKLFTIFSVGENHIVDDSGVITEIEFDEEDGDYMHVKIIADGLYPTAEEIFFYVYSEDATKGEKITLFNFALIQGQKSIDNYKLYGNSDENKVSIKKFIEDAILNNDLSMISESNEIIFLDGFVNLTSSNDEGIDNSYFLPNAPAYIDYINNDASTPPELASIEKIINATDDVGTAFYNWNIIFDSNLGDWTCGMWLKKTDYSTGSLRLHITWNNELGTNSKIATFDILYADLEIGLKGKLTNGGFSADWEMTDEYVDWIYVQFKSVSYDEAHPDNSYVFILPYLLGGTTTGVSYNIFHPCLVLKDVIIDPRQVIYDIKKYNTSIQGLRNIISSGSGYVGLFISEKIETFVGDVLQIFKYNICSAYNRDLYNIQAVSDKVVGIDYVGDDFPRYWEYVTSIVETFNVTFNLYDNDKVLIDSATVEIKIKAVGSQPASNKNIMLVGDSLTFYNRIPDEFARVLKSNDIATTYLDPFNGNTVVMPAGRNLSNISLVGTQKNNYLGWTGQEFHEGYSGFTWNDFVNSNSPFYIGGVLDFNQYLIDNVISSIDFMYIGLGWNDIIQLMTSDLDATVVINNAKIFLRALNAQLPATKVYLWTESFPSLKGGDGNHPSGSKETADVQLWKIRLTTLFRAYQDLVNDVEFSSYVKLIDCNAMFDSENMTQFEIKEKNSRITNTELRGSDDVHPADGGMFQIADGLIRSFIYNHLV